MKKAFGFAPCTSNREKETLVSKRLFEAGSSLAENKIGRIGGKVGNLFRAIEAGSLGQDRKKLRTGSVGQGLWVHGSFFLGKGTNKSLSSKK
ncbi:hypothetical protein MPNT_60011 [Candidatus Methylacidithermus pantelleriae]|uniref:Uncharacterized protein n=1 Tax=Candidatus Methylacidithermus pantelleriae TaxID=2744239 RepID=A0A8J2FU42_9BACT|nr:hypothetical protein MPNT_60011 [Candidatus Methylacidithermus pantelleriae]